ncbi:hypothetical protein [Paraburkholderia kirstenboschensis]|uniref:hypothetical protein n=1 Tax=Paraburkholderia kirstenboschensis TaxID=1245436 RepID=UPI001F414BEE|nr:hypothetical protein [Paraburkholderia kirstenboschensis]
MRVIYDDVLNAELGQSIGGFLFCVFVVRIKDDAGSAIDGFFASFNSSASALIPPYFR